VECSGATSTSASGGGNGIDDGNCSGGNSVCLSVNVWLAAAAPSVLSPSNARSFADVSTEGDQVKTAHEHVSNRTQASPPLSPEEAQFQVVEEEAKCESIRASLQYETPAAKRQRLSMKQGKNDDTAEDDLFFLLADDDDDDNVEPQTDLNERGGETSSINSIKVSGVECESDVLADSYARAEEAVVRVVISALALAAQSAGRRPRPNSHLSAISEEAEVAVPVEHSIGGSPFCGGGGGIGCGSGSGSGGLSGHASPLVPGEPDELELNRWLNPTEAFFPHPDNMPLLRAALSALARERAALCGGDVQGEISPIDESDLVDALLDPYAVRATVDRLLASAAFR